MKNFVVYKSSAGSGKTFTLVKEYLRLALSDNKRLNYNYKRILALTFTNKAASEMKSRVIDALFQISQTAEKSGTGSLLCEDLGIPYPELKQRAQVVLEEILHHYSDFAIGTIDSFTHKIIKTFAYDLKLPVNFSIEMDTKGFYEKVIDTLFSKVGEDAYVGELLIKFALSKTQDNTSWDPQQQIQEFSDLLQKEGAEEYTEQLKQFSSDELEDFRKEFQKFIAYYSETLKEDAIIALNLIKNNNIKDEDFAQKSRGPQKFFKKCAELSIELDDIQGSSISDALLQNKWVHKDAVNKLSLEKIVPELSRLANQLVDLVKTHHAYFLLCKALSKQMYPLMLLKKIEEISEEQKAEDRLVFISEFNRKISDIIHNEPTPFIYERLGERYRHYLLDEFQDTSNLQWHNLLPLMDNSLANGWMNLVVGDGKQSIYRWRNADVKQFALLPTIENKTHNELIAERQNTIERNYKGEVLKVNYRSLKTIVEFNNAFFLRQSESVLSEESKKIYKDQEQQFKNAQEGFVSVHSGKLAKEEVEPSTFAIVHQQITQALNDGFDYKDICIICRFKKSGSVLAKYLIEQKIPVVSSDSLLLANNFEVNTIVAYLTYLANKQDKISAAAVVNYLFQSQQIDEQDYHLYLSELGNGTDLFDIFRRCGIHLNEEELSLNNLFDNCIQVIRALQLNKQGYQYLRFFLDEINEYLVIKNSNISSFFDWWNIRKKSASMIIPDSTNAVKIMTIHTSKGLEFPVVIVPFCNWKFFNSENSWVNLETTRTKLPVSILPMTKKSAELGFEKAFETEQQDQLLDNLNLLYVAFTRAVERLHIVTLASVTTKKGNVAEWVDTFAENLLSKKEEGYFELGSLQKKNAALSHKGLENFKLEPLSFTSSTNAVQIKAAYLFNNSEAEEAKQEGILIHWLLSKMKTRDDLETALQQALIEGLIESNYIQGLRKKLLALCDLPDLQAYYAPGITCKLEAELITAAGELLRPDRIIFLKDETVLIDYKTGKENTKRYSHQLLKYESALLSMGYKNIKKLLVYVDELKLVSVN